MIIHDDVETIIAYSPQLLNAHPPAERWFMVDDLARQVKANLELRPV